MNEFLAIFQHEYAIRALIASVIVGITCGILGCFVTLRRMALIGDALSHAILPGVVAGFLFFGHNPLAIFGGAVLAGLFTAVLITWIQRNSITKDDASIGIVFTAMFALGIIGISWLTKKQGIHLDMKDFLFGNVLGVSDSDLWLTAMIGVYVALVIFVFFKYFFISTFDPVIAATMGISVALIHYFLMFLLSLTIVASLQSVGVILVVAMLIIPASTAYLLTNKLLKMVLISATVGMIAASSGLALAIKTELTPGPMMTLSATFLFLIALLFSPKRGFLVKYVKRLQKNFTIDQQDVLKTIIKLSQEEGVTFTRLRTELHFGTIYLKINLLNLTRIKVVSHYNGKYQVTEVGISLGKKLLRAHRLWETYMTKKMGIPTDKVHESAEKMEHIAQADFWEKVDKALGHPETDPHGSPIPKLNSTKEVIIPLASLLPTQKGKIAESQINPSYLWQIGLMPNTTILVANKSEAFVLIKTNNRTIQVVLAEAKLINVIIEE